MGFVDLCQLIMFGKKGSHTQASLAANQRISPEAMRKAAIALANKPPQEAEWRLVPVSRKDVITHVRTEYGTGTNAIIAVYRDLDTVFWDATYSYLDGRRKKRKIEAASLDARECGTAVLAEKLRNVSLY